MRGLADHVTILSDLPKYFLAHLHHPERETRARTRTRDVSEMNSSSSWLNQIKLPFPLPSPFVCCCSQSRWWASWLVKWRRKRVGERVSLTQLEAPFSSSSALDLKLFRLYYQLEPTEYHTNSTRCCGYNWRRSCLHSPFLAFFCSLLRDWRCLELRASTSGTWDSLVSYIVCTERFQARLAE